MVSHDAPIECEDPDVSIISIEDDRLRGTRTVTKKIRGVGINTFDVQPFIEKCSLGSSLVAERNNRCGCGHVVCADHRAQCERERRCLLK